MQRYEVSASLAAAGREDEAGSAQVKTAPVKGAGSAAGKIATGQAQCRLQEKKVHRETNKKGVSVTVEYPQFIGEPRSAVCWLLMLPVCLR